MDLYTPDYFLHVELVVPHNSARDFQKKMQGFMRGGGFSRYDPNNEYKLVLALRTPKAYSNPRFAPAAPNHQLYRSPARIQRTLREAHQEGAEDDLVHTYVHLWMLPDTRSLDVASVMNASADDRDYIELDSFVAQETQNLVVRINWPGAPLHLPPTPNVGEFVRVVRQFRTRDLGAYLFNVPTLLPTLAAAHWTSFGHYESATGLLNNFTEFWHRKSPGAPDPNHLPSSMAQAFATAGKDPYVKQVQDEYNRTQMLATEKRELYVPYISCSTFDLLIADR